MLIQSLYNLLFLLITLHLLWIKANPTDEARLQSMLRSGSVILTREEAEALVNESQSYGTSCNLSETTMSNNHLPVYVTSLCPWYYELSHRPGFFPSHILRAKLRCGRRESPCVAQNPRDYICKKIRRGIRLVDESCVGQNCEVIERVRVGAQCVRTQRSRG